MEIEIKEKPRMTKEEFAAKWGDEIINSRRKVFFENLNSLLGSHPEETVEYPCLMVSKDKNLFIIENDGDCGFIGYKITEDGKLTTDYSDRWGSSLRPFHGEIIIKQ